MKKFLALLLLVTVLVTGMSFAVSANTTLLDAKLIINSKTQTLETHIEKDGAMYFVSVTELTDYDFTYSITDDEYVLTRYSTEIRVPKTGSTIYKNGKGFTCANAVRNVSEQNGTFYIFANILNEIFGNGQGKISDTEINIKLNAFSATTAKTVSGKVALASGTAASAMEYSVDVIGSETFTTNVTIPAGSASANYTIPVYSDDTNFIIRCRQLNTDVTGYSPVSYYAYKGTVTSPLNASSVGIATTLTADFAIPKSVTVSGNIAGDGDGYIIVENSTGDVIGSTEFYSSSSTGYSVTLPGNTEGAYVRYKVYSGDGIVRYGYFTGNGTSAFANDAAVQNTAINNVFNMNILTGKTISGSLTWNNENASYCTIRAMTTDGKYITDANVYTSDATTFSIVVPSDEYTNYMLVVNTNDSTYSKYASTTGLTAKRTEASIYNVASGDVGYAMVVVDDNAVTSELYGQLKLPDGLVATEDMNVYVYAGALTKNSSVVDGAYSIAETYTTNVTIPAGKKSVDYSISLGDSYNGEKIALGYISGGSSIANGYFDGYNKTLFSTDKDISFSAEKINNIDLYVVTDSVVDVTAVKDADGNAYTSASSNKNSVSVTIKNLTNITNTGTLFVGAYNSENVLVSSAYESFEIVGLSSMVITADMFGDADNAKFLKIFTIDENGSLVSRDIVIL